MLIVGPTLLLPELASAVSRRTGRPELAAAALSRLERIRRLRLVPLDPRLARLAGNLAGQLRLSGADAVYASLAQILRLPLVTWDDEQRRRAAATVQAVTPAQLLAGPIP
jgi:predicted nucleic acid-binding protein